MPKLTKSALQYQSGLLTQVFTFNNPEKDKGLQIYQHNLHMTALRSLSISYPVLEKMIGDQALFILTRRLLDIELPKSGDWADWGANLPSLIAQSEMHEDHPYLTDIAALEWAFHQSSRAAFEDLNIGSLQALSEDDLTNRYFELQPSLRFVSSVFPIHILWQLHRNSGSLDGLTNQSLENAMNTEETGLYIVGQTDSSPQITQVSEDEYQFIQGISEGLSVAALLESFENIDFAHWLTKAMQSHWITGIK
ncbi:putative DNA-binding domain-containing protein [Glaciecola sp. 1036]|uniref:HvfC/BufC family peptide modification chaperone n=1 Tax=Alteromonadaceae TaxID=72275 RepID=UPI003D080EE2